MPEIFFRQLFKQMVDRKAMQYYGFKHVYEMHKKQNKMKTTDYSSLSTPSNMDRQIFHQIFNC